MNPNANIDEQVELAERILEEVRAGEVFVDEDVARLAELVMALDRWLAKGGALPRRWRQAP